MMDEPNKVVGYAYGWKASKRAGRVTVLLQEGGEQASIHIDDIDVFLTVAAALKSEHAHFDLRTRMVYAYRLGTQLSDRKLSEEARFPW